MSVLDWRAEASKGMDVFKVERNRPNNKCKARLIASLGRNRGERIVTLKGDSDPSRSIYIAFCMKEQLSWIYASVSAVTPSRYVRFSAQFEVSHNFNESEDSMGGRRGGSGKAS